MDALLVANRGEIARRILRTARDLGIRALAVYSRVDEGLPHVLEADAAICIGEGPVGGSYLDPYRILDAARRLGADAIHPGYGLLSENPDFARAVTEAGLIWVGPPPQAMRAVADKAQARALAQAHGVPVLPGEDLEGADAAAIVAAAERIGYPLLIKAVAGGGGRGMRRVDAPEELHDALAAARREAGSAFGDDRVLIERFVPIARHIEVQIFGDTHGRVVHLGERECSIQRRYQKIVEEAPSPAVNPTLRTNLGHAATTIAKAVGYVGAGTVEFIVEPDGTFWFLEVNARLQVEHPVTELVTGQDLVAWQLAIAQGEPLPLHQEQIPLTGHAIEVRLCAEDPMRDHLPGTGTLIRFDQPCGPGIRVDAGYAAGDEISPHYDSLVAKILAFGPNRTVATRRLRRALEQTWLPGPVNNLALLKQILRCPAWAAGDLHTRFLQENGLPIAPPIHLAEGAIAAAVAGWARRSPPAPAGFRLRGPAIQRDLYTSFGQTAEVTWRARGSDTLELTATIEGERTTSTVRLLEQRGDQLRVERDGILARWRVATREGGAIQDGTLVYVHLGGGGEAMVKLEPRLPAPQVAQAEPGTLTATTPGTVVAVRVAEGDRVEQGQVLLVLEAMKMEHAVKADQAGIVEVLRASVGQAVAEGEVLVRLSDA
ncbi:MAG: ATP-grasp domain-containing protein [Deltaproteobacteria bacterium]|nr:MAG: ATP-grasp domain-containing protein [Deltaproteobacteria bacterium]